MHETVRKQAAIICLLGLATVALYLCYLIARPFLGPVVIAVMLAIVSYPLHARLHLYFRRPSMAAALSTILVLLIVTIPVVLLGISVSSELRTVVQSLRERGGPQGGLSPYLAHLGATVVNRLGTYLDLSQLDPQAALLRWAEQASRYLLSIGAAAVANLLSFPPAPEPFPGRVAPDSSPRTGASIRNLRRKSCVEAFTSVANKKLAPARKNVRNYL